MSRPDHPEIVIVRRVESEEEHHGGAWKIALADFMTAMMAFFLVMWLVNATDQETKKSVANYFNPIRLAESTADRKGLHNPNAAAPSESNATPQSEGKETKEQGLPQERRYKENLLFVDPYAVLAKLAAEEPASQAQPSADAVLGDAVLPHAETGEVQRDPFDPLYWHTVPISKLQADISGKPNTARSTPADKQVDARAQKPAEATDPAKDKELRTGATSDRIGDRSPADRGPSDRNHSEPAQKPLPAPPREDPKAQSQPVSGDAKSDAKSEAKADAEVGKALESLSGPAAPRVEVKRTAEGLLISLMDGGDFSMFAIGSAEPQPQVVRLMESVAKALEARQGRIVIRGHTDGRPFKSEIYDNWRLSTARAHMASYMLIRAGVKDSRIERIEGHADRSLKNAADPKAAENRRIELLLRAGE